MNKNEAVVIDMGRYDESLEVVEQCAGCEKVFNHILRPAEGALVVETSKCLVYTNPAAKWPGKEGYATHLVNIKSDDGRSVITKEAPVIVKHCPVATHFVRDEVIKATAKQRAGQQKQKKG